MGSEEKQLYFLDVKVNIGTQSGVDLPGFISKISNILCSYSKATTCLHKYKVTGEPRVIAVFEVSNIIGLERSLSGMARLGYVDVTCKPIMPYTTFAQYLKVDSSSIYNQSTSNTLDSDKQLFWLDFTVGYQGKTFEDLIGTWTREATAALGARAGGLHLEPFKVVAERKVQVLIATTREHLDKLSFELPVMKENGNNVEILCHALQSLDVYTASITADDLGSKDARVKTKLCTVI